MAKPQKFVTGIFLFVAGLKTFLDGCEEAFLGVILGPIIASLALLCGAWAYDAAKTNAPPLWKLPHVQITAEKK